MRSAATVPGQIEKNAWNASRIRLAWVMTTTAAIAALHADAPTATETDWVQIAEWYDELVALTDSAVVRLNRAVAIGEARGAPAGLAALAGLDPSLPRFAAVAAHLHEKAGDLATAAEEYAAAARRGANVAEHDHLTRQAARVRRGLAADADAESRQP